MMVLLLVALLALDLAALADAAAVLREGQVCGYPCLNCNKIVNTCEEGLFCLYNEFGCAARYQGVCKKKCNVPQMNAIDCNKAGDHCIWLTRFMNPVDSCPSIGAGCHLDYKRFIFNPVEKCTFPCMESCNKSPAAQEGYCFWNTSSSTCQTSTRLHDDYLNAHEYETGSFPGLTKSPKCWSHLDKGTKSCPGFLPPVNFATTKCHECDKFMDSTLEIASYQDLYCWSVMDKSAQETACRARTGATCTQNSNCELRAPTAAVCTGGTVNGCHAKTTCNYNCRKMCVANSRCTWSQNKCKHKMLTVAPTPLKPTKAPTKRPKAG